MTDSNSPPALTPERRWTHRLRWPALILLTFTAFGYGFVCASSQLPPYTQVRKAVLWTKQHPLVRNAYYTIKEKRGGRTGRWGAAKATPEAEGMSAEQQESVAALLAIGYLDGYEQATENNGVTAYDSTKAQDGVNLYTSGDAEAAYLIDMKGTVLHTWEHDFRTAFPDHPEPDGQPHLEHWRRAFVYPNGDLLAIYEGFGLLKVDKDSNLLWANPLRFHHDLWLDDATGDIWTLSREVKVLERIHPYEPIFEDYVTVLGPDGEVKRHISLLTALEESPFASFLDKRPSYGDLFHSNTIEVFDGRHADRSPLFKKGNVLVSLLKLNVIAILDPESEEIVWALAGQWVKQHQPTLLENGNMLILDNRGHHGMSKVIEFDPFTQQTVWGYFGDEVNNFYTKSCGTAERMDNGNTLITESDSGRAFEVTANGDIVWAFYNPARAGENNDLVATLFEVVRLDKNYVADWVDGIERTPEPSEPTEQAEGESDTPEPPAAPSTD